MDNLADELDLRYHRGLQPEVYYRCPSLESLDDALRNELRKSSASLIPIEVVTEFVFAANSTITVPVTQQSNLDALGFVAADIPQSIAVEHALCHGIHGKDRLKTQRAIARSFIDVVQAIDGFRYYERQAVNKEGGDGVRFKYVCADSLQNRDRRSNKKKKSSEEGEHASGKRAGAIEVLPTYDCGGALYIKFSEKRGAINVVYKHNPIHSIIADSQANSNANRTASTGTLLESDISITQATDITIKKKRKRKTKAENLTSKETQAENSGTPMPSQATTKGTTKKKRKSNGPASPESPHRPTTKKTKSTQNKKPATIPELAHAPVLAKGACIRCKEKKIRCNEQKPTCNQCQRGLWTCQYPEVGPKKRSRNGCINCRQRKRKCTEEKPSCAYCMRIDDECEYESVHS